MKCYWCDVEPDEVFDICSAESALPVRQIAHWPAGDHTHAEAPPTADELADQAYRMLNERVS
jgi:hypothetical protein